MRHALLAALAACIVTLPLVDKAAADGSRQPAGGAHMSSYVTDPFHDPRSLYSQRRSTGQILGQPMLSENAGVHVRRPAAGSHWTSGRSSGQSWRRLR